MDTRGLVLVAGFALIGACCPADSEPGKQGDAGDAGPRVDAGPNDPCAACNTFELAILCDGGACRPPACDAGGGLAVSFTDPKGFRPICGAAFSFDVEAQCGTPPYDWNLVAGGLPWLADLSPMGNVAALAGIVLECDVTPAEIEVSDISGHHAFFTVVLE